MTQRAPSSPCQNFGGALAAASALVAAVAVTPVARAGALTGDIVVEAGVPVTEEELCDAIALRLDDAVEVPLAVFVLVPPDLVRVLVGGQAREVDLSGRTGPAAARYLALAVLDLTLDAGARRAPPMRGSSLGLHAGSGVIVGGRAGAPALFELQAGLSQRWQRWTGELSVAVGWGVGFMGMPPTFPTRYEPLGDVTTGAVRALLARRLGRLELGAGGGIAVWGVNPASGEGRFAPVPVLSAQVGWRFALWRTLEALAFAGVDLHPAAGWYEARLGNAAVVPLAAVRAGLALSYRLGESP